MKFEYYQSENDNLWYFRIVSTNGETVAQSEGIVNEKDCKDTMYTIRSGALMAQIVWVEAP